MLGGELWPHGALKDMAAALLDASLVAMLAIVTISDLRSRIVPDRVLAAAVLIALPICAIAAPESFPARLLAAAGAGGFLLAAAIARPEGMGFGDVKLATVLGVFLGGEVLVALLIALLAGSVAGLVMLIRHGWAARSRAIPFAPFLALGALAAIAPQP
jgi:leader peptidase (prepilin peptidase) / N-methyltransferase